MSWGVLSHALVFHLLGARRVIATDLEPHARPAALHTALHTSVDSVIRDVLAPFEEHARLRTRLDRLLSVRRFDFGTLLELGIEYVSPIDLARTRLNIPVDFVYSNSVLEHVPRQDVALLLTNVVSDLRPGGAMIHCIHLEDHEAMEERPFAFLELPSAKYPSALQSARGNRIRQSEWKRLFDALPDTHSELVYSWTRADRELPDHIDPSISHTDAADLRVTHVGVYTRKKP